MTHFPFTSVTHFPFTSAGNDRLANNVSDCAPRHAAFHIRCCLALDPWMFPVPPTWLSADDAEAKRCSDDKEEFMADASVTLPTL